MSTNFSKTVHILASPEKVWKFLTDLQLMPAWMSDAEITVTTDWTVGSPIVIRGKLHGLSFENKGTVLAFDPQKKLRYNYWCRLFGLHDKPEHYTEIGFELRPLPDGTALTFTQTYAIAYAHDRHAELYWNTTLDILKKLAANV